MRSRLRHRRVWVAAVGVVALAVLAACAPPPPSTYTGLGFDTCGAPSTGQMGAWLSSPYHSIGIYIGGRNRACPDGNLSAAWVGTVANEGWRLAPLYVGLQAPCNPQFATIDFNNASNEGSQAAQDAVSRAQTFGLGAGTPIYFDMEGYDNTVWWCSYAVLVFVNSWDAELHALGYKAGYYSSAGSGIADQVYVVQHPSNFPGYNVPDDIWFAHWNGVASAYGDPYVPDEYWAYHQRIHQYQGGHNESYGGVTLNIDNNANDALLAG